MKVLRFSGTKRMVTLKSIGLGTYKYKGHEAEEENIESILHRAIDENTYEMSQNPSPNDQPSESLNNDIGLFNGAGLKNFPVPVVAVPTIPKVNGSFSFPGLTTLDPGLPVDDMGANALNL
jgi:hypothetical protein